MSDNRCECCGEVGLGSHLLDFHDGAPVFVVCEACALEGVERGLGTAIWIGLSRLEAHS